MNTKVRSVLVAVAFAAIAVAALAAATITAQTRETSLDGLCATAAWPKIPANCLEGSNGLEVRMVGADVDAYDAEADAEADEFNQRFQVAFN